MSQPSVEIVELAAWGFDPHPYRPFTSAIPAPPEWSSRSAILSALRPRMEPLLGPVYARPDLQAEFAAFRWSIEVVDLRHLLAFQRRLVLDPVRPAPPAPHPEDWPSLLALSFGPPRALAATWLDAVTLQSPNPDLQLRRLSAGTPELYGGSPFLEVACVGDRAILRDGYHRAFHLLAGGVTAVPAVVFELRSLTEVYPTAPWFLPASVLLGDAAPRVTDFHNPALTLRYRRPRQLRTITLSMDDAFELQQDKELQTA